MKVKVKVKLKKCINSKKVNGEKASLKKLKEKEKVVSLMGCSVGGTRGVFRKVARI